MLCARRVWRVCVQGVCLCEYRQKFHVHQKCKHMRDSHFHLENPQVHHLRHALFNFHRFPTLMSRHACFFKVFGQSHRQKVRRSFTQLSSGGFYVGHKAGEAADAEETKLGHPEVADNIRVAANPAHRQGGGSARRVAKTDTGGTTSFADFFHTQAGSAIKHYSDVEKPGRT